MGTVKLKNLIGSKEKVTPSFREVFLFGSVLREDFRSAISDVDLGLIFSLEAEKSAVTRCAALTSLRSRVKTWEGKVIKEYQLASNAPRISPLLVTDVEVERDIVKKVETFFSLRTNEFFSLLSKRTVEFESGRALENGVHRHVESVLKKVQEVRAGYVKVDRFGVYRGDLQDCSELESLKPLFRAARTLMAEGDFDVDNGMLQLIQLMKNGVGRGIYLKDYEKLLVDGIAGRRKKTLTAKDQMFLWEVLADEAYRVLKGQAATSNPAATTISLSVVEVHHTGQEHPGKTESSRETEGSTSAGGGATEKIDRENAQAWLEELRKELEKLLSGLSSEGWERVCQQFKQEGISRDKLAAAIVRKISFLDLCEILQEVQRHLLLKSDYDLIDEIVDRVLPLNHDRQFIRSLQQADAGTFFQLGLVSNVILGETVMAAVENRAVKIDVRRGQPDTMFPLTQPGDRGPESADWSDTIIKGVYKGFQTVFLSVNSTVSDDSINVDVAVSELNAWAGTTLKRRRAAPYCVVQVEGADEKLTSYREAVRDVAEKLPGIRFLQQVIRLAEDEHRMVKVMTIRRNQQFKAV